MEVVGKGRKVKLVLDEGNDSKNILRNDLVMGFFLNNGAVEKKEKCQGIPGGNDGYGLSGCVSGMFVLEYKPNALVLRGRVLRRC